MKRSSTGVDAIVVLGCRVGPGGSLSIAALRRVERATQAYRDGVAETVIACGGRRWSGVAEATAMQDELERRGVPRAQVWLELCSLTTVENAIFATAIARERFGRAELAVVTSAFHLPRALDDFARCGARAIGLAAPDPPGSTVHDLMRALKERLSDRLDRGILERSGRFGEDYVGRPRAGASSS